MKTTPINLFNRQDKNTPEKMLLERLEIILGKNFSTQSEELEDGYSADEIDDAYYNGAEEVKEYLRDTLQLYCYERGAYSE